MTNAPAMTKEEKQQKAHRSLRSARAQAAFRSQARGTLHRQKPTQPPLLYTLLFSSPLVPGLSVSLGFRVTADAVKLTVISNAGIVKKTSWWKSGFHKCSRVCVCVCVCVWERERERERETNHIWLELFWQSEWGGGGLGVNSALRVLFIFNKNNTEDTIFGAIFNRIVLFY